VGIPGLWRNHLGLPVAKEILSRLFRSRRVLHQLLWLGGTAAGALLAWNLAAWLALHSSMQLNALRLVWVGAGAFIGAAGLLGWRSNALSFASWVVREEKRCGVLGLWSTVIGVEPSNPFFARLDAEAAEALRARSGDFKRRAALRGLGLVALGAVLLGGMAGFRALSAELKIAMALGRVDDAIQTQALSTIARGEPWSLRVQSLQPGPWVAEIQGVPVALTNGRLTLQSLGADTPYRIVTPWGHSRWQSVHVYEPVQWEQLRLRVRPPAYLQLADENYDLLHFAGPARVVVAGSKLSLRGTPTIEWRSRQRPDEWLAETGEADEVRPVRGERHGLWMSLPVRVVPDAPPEVRWVRPDQDVTWGEKKTAAEIDASDDWNVCEMRLRIRRLGSTAAVTLALYRGRERRHRGVVTVTPAVMPEAAQPGLYEMTPSATDSAGQTAEGEKRFIEIKPEPAAEGADGPSAKEPASLRALMVALLDTLRDWNREGRLARLARVRLELDAMAKVAETPPFRQAAERWIELLGDRATRADVETVVQEMAQIQQQSESQKPQNNQAAEPAPEPGESVTASDIEKIEMLQRAALDDSISPQLRDQLQKKVQEQFDAITQTLKKQVPAAADLVRDIAMTQEKLSREWSRDLAMADVQQLELLKGRVGKAGQRPGAQSDPSKQRLLDQVQGQVEGDQAVAEEQLATMRELASRDSGADWSSLEAASQKWNRARRSGLASLRDRTKDSLLNELRKSMAAQAPSPPPEDQSRLAGAIGAAAARGDWENAERFAKQAQWTPAMLGRLQQAKNEPVAARTELIRGLLGAMLNHASEQAQRDSRRELEKVMPIDPSWEPDVDKYFEKLNNRDPGP
jgi:hypothetical protein